MAQKRVEMRTGRQAGCGESVSGSSKTNIGVPDNWKVREEEHEEKEEGEEYEESLKKKEQHNEKLWKNRRQY